MIQAIETHYKGYRFRSRLEARWAVFFDTLNIRWEYEKEGYDLGSAGWYLPDFWLLDEKCWVEIKPDVFNLEDVDRKLTTMMWQQEGTNIYLLAGNPWPGEYVCLRWRGSDSGMAQGYDGDDITFKSHCNRWGFDWGAIALREIYGSAMQAAYIAARSARFEHGETPRVQANQ